MLPPPIDPRDINALIRQMKEMAPFYTPEWKFTPENPDPGTALFLIFAEMFQENIKRFNMAPVKNQIAFINMFDMSFLPARPARAYVTFRLSDGSKEPVFIPAGTRVMANAPDGGSPIIFETERNMLATPALPGAAYNVSTKKDSIVAVPQECYRDLEKADRPQFFMFSFPEEENIQEHTLYLGHSYILNIGHTALVELEIRNSFKRYKEPHICEKLADPNYVEWSYLGDDQWRPFEQVEARGNRLILKKAQKGIIPERYIKDIACRWIRCRAKHYRPEEFADIEADGIGICANYYDAGNNRGMAPDMVFCNDIQKDVDGFHPFGEYFNLYDTFYLSSQEVLSKKESTVTISFRLKNIPLTRKSGIDPDIDWKMIMRKSDFKEPKFEDLSIMTVSWEYWNGGGWVKLLADKEYEEIFYKPVEQEITVKFKCPGDMEKSFVNDQQNYWIRVRILSIENIYAPNAVFHSPWIENIALRYRYTGNIPVPERCLTFNNLEYLDRTENVLVNGEPFRPFYSFELSQPAFYLGFTEPPLKGPVSLFFSVLEQMNSEEEIPVVEWEYLRRVGGVMEWAALKTIDGTNAFTRSGAVVFAGPGDFAGSSLFGKDLYWIRAVNRDGRYEQQDGTPHSPVVKGIYINTTRVVQQESIQNEIIEASETGSNREYRLKKFPVVSEEVWVNEAGDLTGGEMSLLLENQSYRVKEVRDNIGKIEEFWVKWKCVDDFLDSGPGDRHYVIDRSSGVIYFGDGKSGKNPPVSRTDRIKVNYKIGGGKKGNLAAREISSLFNSIAFVDGVFNPEPSGGGCDMETFDEAVRRGPQILKHRNRAVTPGDFEWLVRQASQNVARVKCLPNYNMKDKRETGSVTVVIVPEGGSDGRIVFPELKQQVEKYLLERAANLVAFQEKIRIIEPAYLEISVYAVLVVNDLDTVTITEKEAVDRLNEFLHPLNGHFNGKGWEIGQHPHVSVFFALLKSIGAVNHVEKVSMTVYKIEDGLRTEINPEHISNIAHGMVINGKHRVIVKVL